MALVAYSDESDYSDSDETEKPIVPLKDSKNDSQLTLTSIINNTVNTGEASNSLQSQSKPLSTLKNEIVNEVEQGEDEDSSLKGNLASSSVSNFELDDNDLVNDVPTVSTWSITKDIQNLNASDRPFMSLEKSKGVSQKKKSKIKFILPALSEFDEEEEDENEEEKLQGARKKLKPSGSGSGLFAMLPQPRGPASLVPQSVSRKTTSNTLIKKSIPKPKDKKSICVNSLEQEGDRDDDEVESSPSNDFFSLAEPQILQDSSPTLMLPPVSRNVARNTNPVAKVTDGTPSLGANGYSHSDKLHLNEEICSSSSYIPLESAIRSSSSSSKEAIDEEALLRLTGRRNKNEIVNLIDINADDALMSKEEWTTRVLCDEKPRKSFSKKREGMPTQQQKRKHQITFLAHQAQEREQELRNVWGQNRMTKMQTQSKYGF